MDLDRFRLPVGAVFATAAALFLSLPAVVQGLLFLQAIDVASGILAAGANGQINSDLGWRKLFKVPLTWCVIGTVYVVEGYLPEIPVPLAAIVVGFYCANVALSVIENAGRGGVGVPPWLREAFEKLSTGAPHPAPKV